MDSLQESKTLKAALNVLRTAPASDAETNLSSLQELLSPNPDALAELTQHVHLPLQTAMDGDTPYISCCWNRDGPSLSNDNALQAQANELWNTYSNMYYGSNAVSSVYVVTVSPTSTRYCFLLQKQSSDVGEWNSVHIVNVSQNTTARTTTYTIQSDILVLIGNEISARLDKQTTTTINHTTSPVHYMETIGPLLESVETELRSCLENVQLPKLQDVVTQVRRKERPKMTTPGMNHTAMLNQAVLARAAMQKKQTQG